jgi:hypothetical protein
MKKVGKDHDRDDVELPNIVQELRQLREGQSAILSHLSTTSSSTYHHWHQCLTVLIIFAVAFLSTISVVPNLLNGGFNFRLPGMSESDQTSIPVIIDATQLPRLNLSRQPEEEEFLTSFINSMRLEYFPFESGYPLWTIKRLLSVSIAYPVRSCRDRSYSVDSVILKIKSNFLRILFHSRLGYSLRLLYLATSCWIWFVLNWTQGMAVGDAGWFELKQRCCQTLTTSLRLQSVTIPGPTFTVGVNSVLKSSIHNANMLHLKRMVVRHFSIGCVVTF